VNTAFPAEALVPDDDELDEDEDDELEELEDDEEPPEP